MRKQVTVIIGGGSIGLCTAYSLATQYRNKRDVIVLEALPDPFQAASATNTGCLRLHFEYPSEQADLMPLGKYPLRLWQQLSELGDVSK